MPVAYLRVWSHACGAPVEEVVWVSAALLYAGCIVLGQHSPHLVLREEQQGTLHACTHGKARQGGKAQGPGCWACMAVRGIID